MRTRARARATTIFIGRDRGDNAYQIIYHRDGPRCCPLE
jgi:hypothetical protein